MNEFNLVQWLTGQKREKMTAGELKAWLKSHHNEIMEFLTKGGNSIPQTYPSKVDELNRIYEEELRGQKIKELHLHAIVQRECNHIMYVRFDQYDWKSLEEWCERCCRDRYIVKQNSFALGKGYCHKVFFKNERDATLFKLSYETL